MKNKIIIGIQLDFRLICLMLLFGILIVLGLRKYIIYSEIEERWSIVGIMSFFAILWIYKMSRVLLYKATLEVVDDVCQVKLHGLFWSLRRQRRFSTLKIKRVSDEMDVMYHRTELSPMKNLFRRFLNLDVGNSLYAVRPDGERRVVTGIKDHEVWELKIFMKKLEKQSMITK